jgi:hypothetical protein
MDHCNQNPDWGPGKKASAERFKESSLMAYGGSRFFDLGSHA